MNDIYAFGLSMNWWQWLSFAVALFSIELMFPGLFAAWFGVGAVLTSIVVFSFGVSGIFPIVSFLVLGGIIGFFGHAWLKKSKTRARERLERELVGRSITLKRPIENGFGREKIENAYRTLRGGDAIRGEKVVVTGIDGNDLIVGKA